MTNYQIKIGAQANADIAETVAYIGQVLREPRTAGHLYRLIKEEILSLEHMPERYPFEDDDRLRALGIRKLLVKRYKILYFVNQDQRVVQIVRVIYAGRDISRLLEDSGFLRRHGREFCVSDIRQSQGWRFENRANWGLKPFLTTCPGGRGGMRVACGVNAALASGIR